MKKTKEVQTVRDMLFERWWNSMQKIDKVWLRDFGAKNAFEAGMDAAPKVAAGADTRRMNWLSKPGNKVMRLGPFYRCYSNHKRCTTALFNSPRAAIDGALFDPKVKK